jgi:hypothetical protein
MTIRKRYLVSRYCSDIVTHVFRYSEFDTLRQRLAATFPKSGQAMPALPPKSAFCKSLPATLEAKLTLDR